VAKNFDAALVEIAKILLVDKSNTAALQLEELIRKEHAKVWEEKYKKIKNVPKEAVLESYKRTLKDAWMDGSLGVEELEVVEMRKVELEITEQEHSMIEREAKILSYEENLKKCWQNGSINQAEQEELDRLRLELNITAEQHMELEQKARRTV
jgi:hypothetical protein